MPANDDAAHYGLRAMVIRGYDAKDYGLQALLIGYGIQSAVVSGYLEPNTYKQMLNRPAKECNLWLVGCEKEFSKMKQQKVWVVIPFPAFFLDVASYVLSGYLN